MLGLGLGLDSAFINTEIGGSANLELPIVLNSSIPGLSLTGAPKVIVSWPDVTDLDSLQVHFQDLDAALDFEWFSASGIAETTPLSKLNDGEGVGTIDGQADLRLHLHDRRTIDVDLGQITEGGQTTRAVRTVGVVIERIASAHDSNDEPARVSVMINKQAMDWNLKTEIRGLNRFG